MLCDERAKLKLRNFFRAPTLSAAPADLLQRSASSRHHFFVALHPPQHPTPKMKFSSAISLLLVGSAAAFAPAPSSQSRGTVSLSRAREVE